MCGVRVLQKNRTHKRHIDTLQIDVKPNPQKLGRESICQRLFQALPCFAGQEVKYLEHHNGGHSFRQLQNPDFTEGLSSFGLHLNVNGGRRTLGCCTISSALHCGHQLSLDQKQPGTRNGLAEFDLRLFLSYFQLGNQTGSSTLCSFVAREEVLYNWMFCFSSLSILTLFCITST